MFSSSSYPYPTKWGGVQHVFYHVVIKIRQLFLRPAACLTSTLLEIGVGANHCKCNRENGLTCLPKHGSDFVLYYVMIVILYLILQLLSRIFYFGSWLLAAFCCTDSYCHSFHCLLLWACPWVSPTLRLAGAHTRVACWHRPLFSVKKDKNDWKII
jgi:hypothetical protein